MDLNFAINKKHSWRGKTDSNIPDVDEMLEDILCSVNDWNVIKQKGNQRIYRQKIKKLRVKYIVHTQLEEDIGVQNQDQTERIIDTVDEEFESMHIMKRQPFAEINIENKKSNRKRKHSNDEKENIIEKSQRYEWMAKTTVSEGINEKPIFQDSLSQSSQEMIEEEIDEKPNVSDKKRIETLNLYNGLRHLENIIEKENCGTVAERKELEHLVEINVCIQETHKILMNGLLPQNKSGTLSTSLRKAWYDGKITFYQYFTDTKYAEIALQCITDEYHSQLKKIKEEMENDLSKGLLAKIFRLASIFVFSFLQLHPFADGNGRLGRLLCSYVLGLFTPFPSPIYNVFADTCRNDYMKTLRNAMEEMKFPFSEPKEIKSESEAIQLASTLMAARPSDLCSLMIESNWYMWKNLFSEDFN